MTEGQAVAEEVPPGYKRTEAGAVPEGWEIGLLGDIASIRNQKILPSNVDPDTLCVELEHIGQGNGQLLEVSIAQNSTSSKYCFFTGDVLFGRLRSYLRKFWHADRDGICTTEIWPLMVNTSLVDSVFLYAIVQSNQFVETASISYGTHMPRADWNVMKNLEVHLPPLPEQRPLAGALSDADGLIGALDALIEKKRAIKRAAMQQLLTGKTRLPGFEGEWKVKRLGEIGRFAKGRGIKRDDVTDEGSPCIRYGELYTRYHNYITTPVSRIPPAVAQTALPIQTGDLLFAGSGETAEDIGRCVAYLGDEQAYAGGDIVVLTPSGQNSIYLGYLMDHPLVTAQKARLSQGDVIVHISATNLAQVEINLPPIDEQRAIAAVLSDMDAGIAALKRRRDKINQIKQGMMQELLTGRTRLIDPPEAPA